MIENRDCWWLYWCPHLTWERWREECERVERCFSLFRPFAEAPFLGFRGVVARSGTEYHVTVAAEMDMYPRLQPWVFLDPPVAGARDDGKLVLDLHWDPASPSFEMVIGAVIAHVEKVHAGESG